MDISNGEIIIERIFFDRQESVMHWDATGRPLPF
jgi:hypothetical protein